MGEKWITGYLKYKGMFMKAVDDFVKKEKGASDIVAILLVIVVLIAVVAIFREQLIRAIETAFGTLMEALGGE